MSDAPTINAIPMKSSRPVEGSVAKGPAVAVLIKPAECSTTVPAMAAEKDAPRPACAKTALFARPAGGKHNSITAHSMATRFSLIFVLLHRESLVGVSVAEKSTGKSWHNLLDFHLFPNRSKLRANSAKFERD